MINSPSPNKINGLRVRRKVRQNGFYVSIYDTAFSGHGLSEKDGRWLLRCETHKFDVRFHSLRGARAAMPYPLRWCAKCRKIFL